MATIPSFPSKCNYWNPGNAPPAPPDRTNISCELVTGARHTLLRILGVNGAVPEPWVELWFPDATAGLTASTTNPGAAGGQVEFPAGSGRQYYLRQLERRGWGFPNQFVACWVSRVSSTTAV